ncbi:MAG: hypothetical protein HQL82_03500 [Magnetococcales bacterium]|nr:hypothetical protein [Magnetococcales bacterium]
MGSAACLLFFLMIWAVSGHGAPLDEFLTAQPGYPPLHGELELGYDVMNSNVDYLRIRDRDVDFAGTQVGDYEGYHLRGGLALTRRLWLDGGLATRNLATTVDPIDAIGWHRALQYQVTVNLGVLPALGLRVSQWGNYSREVNKTSSTTFQGITFDNVRVAYPRDAQTQADLIATWGLGKHEHFSFFLGGGESKVSFDEFFVELKSGCEYSINSASPYNISGYLTRGDPVVCEILSFDLNDRDPKYPGEGLQMAYRAEYRHFGGMYLWFNDNWRTKVGFRFQKLDRTIDSTIKDAGISVYDSNLILSAELGYKPFQHVGFFARTQFMSNQLVGEIPFSYNRYTAGRFDRRYGLLTVGIQAGF